MSDSDVDAVAGLIIPDAATFASLPQLLARLVFLALPVDARGRACCVCRAWRDALDDPSLWTRLNMSSVERDERRLLSTVFVGAAGRARGQLCHLDLSQREVFVNYLLSVLTANAGSLRELHLHLVYVENFGAPIPTFRAVVAAAPLLQVLTVEYMFCDWNDAPRVLRAEPPFAPLELRGTLVVAFARRRNFRDGGMERVGPFAAALANATLQPALSQIQVVDADTAQPAVMGALVDAAVARGLRHLSFSNCTPPAAAPLARLLTEGSITEFDFSSLVAAADEPLFDVAGAALVANALRVNTTLTKLNLSGASLCVDVRAAGMILGALIGHPSLRDLGIIGEETTTEACSALGAALAALIAADAPALLALTCFSTGLEDAGLAPIVEALRLNHHLRKLNCHSNGMSEAFARQRLLPAVRANATLRELKCAHYERRPFAAKAEAEELVRRRAQHD
jgi:hypothetical protein